MANKGDSAGQKARNRERGKEQEAATGIKPTRGGSSGVLGFMSRVRKRSYQDVESDAVHVGDFAALLSNVNVTAAGPLVTTITVPGVYELDLLAAFRAQAHGFMLIRCYVVPRRPFFDDPEPEGDDDEG